MTERLLQESMTLAEMDEVLERFVTEHSFSVRILTDIPLSEDEYGTLLEKLSKMKKDMPTLQRYRLCVLTAWAYALYYGEDSASHYHQIIEELEELPQYSVRQFLNLCASTFEDFGLNTYYSGISSRKQLYGMMVAQAGISEEMAPAFCGLLDEMLDGKTVESAMEEMKDVRNEQMGFASDSANYHFLANLLLSASKIMDDCRSGNYTEEEILKKYYITSSRLIHICWAHVKDADKVCA